MALTDIPILSLLRTRLDWSQQRQRVLPENVANADTPHYRARDLQPLKFEAPGKVADSGIMPVSLAQTEPGHFYRSVHFSFAKVGIPSVSIGTDEDYAGKPTDYGAKVDEDYNAHRYHQPSDAYSPDFDLSGAVQISSIVLKFAHTLANAAVTPTWNADAEFKAAREKSLKPVS